MPQQLNIASAPVIVLPDGRLRLDRKFVEGMHLSGELWDGRFDALLWQGALEIPFGAEYAPGDLGFRIQVLEPDETITARHLEGYDVAGAAADYHLALDLPALCGGPGQPRLVYSIEYTLATRLQIIRLDQSRGPLRKLRSAIWNLNMERHRRAALKAADGVQANGFPAMEEFKGLNANTILYLDNRMTTDMMATEAEMEARAAHLLSGGPLRLIHSGRLETMKGVQDIVPIARILGDAGVDFTLDIYGAGSLEAEIRAGIARFGLADRVRLHGPVDFETGLVPIQRRAGDLFLSCHRQADPSCTYIESMGCGLPVAGYSNAMWAAMRDDADAGWCVPLGDTSALAQQIIALDKARGEIVAHGERALSYARRHDFRTVFASRIRQLAEVVAV